MITPIRQVSAYAPASNPIALNPQKAYRDTVNYARVGEKLNINCNDQRYVVRNGVRLDYLA